MKIHKRKLGILLLLGMLGLYLTGGCLQQENSKFYKPKNFLTYENGSYGVRIKYPQEWTKTEGAMGTVVVFLSPKQNDSDPFQENLNIIVQNLPASTTLNVVTEETINQVKQLIQNATIIESTDTTLAGVPAYKIVYSGKMREYTLKWIQIWTVKNNKMYSITYTAEINSYSYYLDVIQKMIDSFEII